MQQYFAVMQVIVIVVLFRIISRTNEVSCSVIELHESLSSACSVSGGSLVCFG